MNPLLHAMSVAHSVAGAFDITTISNHTSVDADGQTVSGTLAVAADGSADWTGDTFGTSENESWWLPEGTVVGTWHVKVTYDSGTNQRSSGTALNTWTAVGSFSMGFSKASAGGPDSTTGNYTIHFSDDGGSTTYDSKAFSITLQEQAP